MKEQSIKSAKSVFQIEIDCIKGLEERFDEQAFSKAVELLKNAPRIGTSGCGHSGIMCQHFTHLLCCVEQPARFISPAEAVHGATGYLQKGDVMVFASRGGKTGELLPILDICKTKGVKVITVTENLDSPLAKGADVVLKQYVNRETDKYHCCYFEMSFDLQTGGPAKVRDVQQLFEDLRTAEDWRERLFNKKIELLKKERQG